VLDFVRSDPEMGGGRREGNVIYETKIPYMTKLYLAETDPKLKRYYACHCPWAREAIKNENVVYGSISLPDTINQLAVESQKKSIVTLKTLFNKC